ncbi:MAG: glycerol-3-phosphate acyltransferase [Candidatus Promineifilaceae bacterium]|nr:glycerol-3-phosphate acyltransferase [Candidatus Promineifilaceae bacterium]
MTAVLWTSIAFLSGALPFSVWIGRLALGHDIRQIGDHNPGAANVYRAGGKRWGALAIILDFLKGAAPVSLAHYAVGLAGWSLVIVALAPILGHAYSPLLGFRGGKALAVTFGIWTGLTLWQVPLALGLFLALWLALLAAEGWAVLFGMLTLLGGLALAGASWELFAVWLGNFLILTWKHRHDLQQLPRRE